MALLAEELVEEWLNRQGYFTIRGIKLGIHEMDLLAVRPGPRGIECRQIEVQASVRPIGYITDLPKSVQEQTGRRGSSVKIRSDGELRKGIREWIANKYDHPKKKRLRGELTSGPWTRELIVHVVKHEREIQLIQEEGIKVWRLGDIVAELKRGGLLLKGAAGAHLVDLVAIVASPEG